MLTICFSTAFGLLGSTYIGAADACCDYLNDYMVWRGQGRVVAGVVKEFAFLAEDEAFIWLCHLAGVSFFDDMFDNAVTDIFWLWKSARGDQMAYICIADEHI